ncbi:class I SAM-dependent methyltransferase [Dyella flava]|uniref:Class I SAM-dependent methyltransferase n=1 Tax=Dyella flava TaxID=1920170 RepID=A0ABS2K9N3_9GAMM|nr:class I SAM-dependent methyltransferase [Dyella flava]MBM7127669.1 class I SAM-dependent methyltransferase [Dyella flava]GLQ51267.1 hypothetical protein GCM10010872_27160 [Dyella flava]
MWNITEKFPELLAARYQIGPMYGSEDICMLFYTLVRREKPEVVVELGTGMGVTTAWIAAAMKENGFGTIYTYDNGSHFDMPDVRRFLAATPSGPLESMRQVAQQGSYEAFIFSLFDLCDVREHIAFKKAGIDLNNPATLTVDFDHRPIDLLFSDYMHSPDMVENIVRAFLPRMAGTSSIFIDSASSHVPSFLTLELIIKCFNEQKIPKRILQGMSAEDLSTTRRLLSESQFQLMHLMEKRDRAQNSTSWIRIEPVDTVPPVTAFFH